MSFIRLSIIALFVFVLGASLAAAQSAQTPAPPQIATGTYWADPSSDVEVFLVGSGHYRLIVISGKPVKVTYRTSINSVEPVVKELVPVCPVDKGVTIYEVEHYFSKMTIWMALDFTVDGKRVPGLTRAFYNDISTLAPNDMFFGPPH